MSGPYIIASTPSHAFMLIREELAMATAIASGAHDWDQLDSIQGIAIALEAVKDLETMVNERDAELSKFRARWGTP